MDVKKAIEYLYRQMELGRIKNDTEQEVYELAIDALRKQLKDKWIPVSERLPNDLECNKFDDMHPSHREFLCTIKIENRKPQTRVLFYSQVFGWKYGADDYNRHVVAWKPMPEPYKGD